MKKGLPIFLVCLILFFWTIVSCSKSYSFEKSAGTLKDSSGNCMQYVVMGTYSKGNTLSANTNYILVPVRVTKLGYYSIYSDFQNGFKFADSGIFTSLGLQQVRLKPVGIPLKDTLTSFICSYSNTNCSFSINVSNNTNISTVNTDTVALNTWKFTDSSTGGFHHGIFADGNAFYGPDLNGYVLTMVGWMDFRSPSDTILVAQIFMPHSTIDTGYYVTEGSNAFLFALNTGLINQQARYFSANGGTHDTLTFHIISFNQQTNNVIGTFSGKATTDKLTSAYISNGYFNAHVK